MLPESDISAPLCILCRLCGLFSFEYESLKKQIRYACKKSIKHAVIIVKYVTCDILNILTIW
jgi:hypothetical protein